MKDLATSNGAQHVLIIGGGASGVLMAAHLLRRKDQALRVTLLEGQNLPGCGVAYSTTDPNHLLNTRVHNMSAFPDDPHHFHRWLINRPEGKGISDQCFVSRVTYGAYLAELLAQADSSRFTCLRQTCVKLEETATGVLAQLASGPSIDADIAILATGHVQPELPPDSPLSAPWKELERVDPAARIVIIGSGLSMVDQVLSLLKSGHRGEIVTLSRRGQLPRAHAKTTPLKITPDQVPLGAPLSQLTAWLRALAREAQRQGGGWRDAVDGIRPHIRSLWQHLPLAERARFLRHGATWWDVHRHRMPPASEHEILKATASGQLRHRRGDFIDARHDDSDNRLLRLRPHGCSEIETLSAARIIDCRGIRRDPQAHASPLIADLLQRGAARIDALRVGLDISPDNRLIGATGKAAGRIYAIGPVSCAAFWEITAIPDIREQTAQLANQLALANAKVGG